MGKMQKKVLLIIEDGSFTFDNRVIREATALVDNGWDVTVICAKNKKDPFYSRYNQHLRCYFYPKQEAQSAFGHILEHGVSILAVTLLAWFVFLRHGFRVIHAANPMDILWIPSLPFKIFGVRYIFDHHDLSPELYLSRGEGGEKSLFFHVLTWLEKMSFKFANVVISTNESYKKVAIERGGKQLKDVFVVRNGPNLEKFKSVPPRKDLKNEGDILVGYLGNMNPQDGVDYLLRAAEEIIVNREIKNIRFVFVGGGSYQTTLVKIGEELGLSALVTFTGRIPDDQMLSTLCACDICVQPDPLNPLNDKSTMNKVMEYMALEKPVIAFDLVETRVSCGDAAVYAKPNSIIDLANTIIELSDNPQLRLAMGQRGRKRVEEALAWSFSVHNLLAAYDQVSN